MADSSSCEASATESNPGQRTPPTVSPSFMKTLEGELKDIVEEEEGRRGLAIVVGAEDLPGVKQDMATMKNAFHAQGLAVWKMPGANSAQIAGAVQAIANYTFPQQYEVLIFYFCGLAGSQDEDSYINCKTVECGGDDTLSIEKGIISPLCDLQLQRMFLFDCCLVDNTARSFHNDRFSIPAPPSPRKSKGRVAYATSTNSSDRVDGAGGSVWTKNLARLLKLDRINLDKLLHLSTKETVLHHKQRHEKELKNGKMVLHGPDSRNGEEVDSPSPDCEHKLVYQKDCHGDNGPETSLKHSISYKSPTRSK